MAKPTIPTILTEADWNKKKGTIAKMVAETGVGAAMADLKRAYDDVKWDKLDIQKALKNPGTASDISVAYKAAKAEYDTKVIQVITKANVVNDRALGALAKYKNAKVKVPESSKEQARNVQKAAVAFAAQVTMVKAELEAFKKVKALDTVETIVGKNWFDSVRRVEIDDHPDLLTFARVKGATLGPTGKPDPKLVTIHGEFVANMRKWGEAVAKLQALRPKKLGRREAIKATLDLWLDAADAFWPMAGGVQGKLGEWVQRRKELAGSDKAFGVWIKQNPDQWQAAEEAGETMTSLAPDLQLLGKHIEDLK